MFKQKKGIHVESETGTDIRSSEHYFVRINSICESKHGAEVALELRDSFDSSQNL